MHPVYRVQLKIIKQAANKYAIRSITDVKSDFIMSTDSIEFILPTPLALGKVKSALKQKLKYTEQPIEHLEISCLDSFDWRLFKKGLSVEAIEQDKSTRLYLRK